MSLNSTKKAKIFLKIWEKTSSLYPVQNKKPPGSHEQNQFLNVNLLASYFEQYIVDNTNYK